VDQAAGQVRFIRKREKIPSIMMMQIIVPHVPMQSCKEQNSLFLKGLGMMINDHSYVTWHHTSINDDFFVQSA
jgi:hypothetical protein